MQSTKNTSSPPILSVEYDGFSGINRSEAYSGKGGISDIVNFRLTADGALRKRAGAVKVATLNSKPRAYCETDDGNALILMSNRFGILNTDSFSASTITTVGTFSGDADIFCYDGKMFLMDGSELYVYENNDLFPVQGYAPLYGKNWHPTSKGDVYQKPNLLSDKIRISYTVKEPNPSRFFFDQAVKSIDGVYVDGAFVNSSRFALEESASYASCGLDLATGSTVMFYLTVDNLKRTKVTGMTRALLYGSSDGRGIDTSSVVFYNEGTLGTVACTRRIDTDEFADASMVYHGATAMYVTDDDILTVGDGTAVVNAVRRRGKKLLVFTARETFALTESDGISLMFPISSYAGCSTKGGALSIQDRPVTVSEAGILVWSPISYDNDEYVAECISAPIDGLTSPSFFRSSVAHLNRRTSELWFSDPMSADKRVFIYNTVSKQWYSYSGISADMFVEIKSKTGFFKENDLYVFDDDATDDSDGSTVSHISSYFSTGILNFGDTASTKRICRVSAAADPDSDLEISIRDDTGRMTSDLFSTSLNDKIGYAEKKLSIPRSRHYTVTATARSSAPVNIRYMKLTAVE